MDHVVETTTTGWLSRLKDAIAGVLVGLIMLVIAPVLLFMNEGRSVNRARTLAFARENVVEAKADAVDAALEGKLVHVTGKATTAEQLEDPEFGVRLNAIRLVRKGEMYQWHERKKEEKKRNIGGSETTETTYDYHKDWDDDLIQSSSFHETTGHENPTALPFPSRTVQATDVRLGAYELSDEQVSDYDAFSPLTGPELPAPRAGLTAIQGGYYRGQSYTAPAIGDARVTFTAARPGDLSVVAQQTGSTFRTMSTDTGPLRLQATGVVSAEQLVAAAESENAFVTWLLRGVGFFLMTIGIGLVLRPLVVVADVVPIIGSIVGMGTGCAALGLAAVGSLFTIALGWLFYRPLIGVPLLVLALGGLVGLFVLASKRKAARAAR